MALRQLFLLVIFTGFSFSALHAQAIFETVGSFDWSTSGSSDWNRISGTDGDGIPDANDSVRVNSGQLRYDSDAIQVGKIEIDPGSSLDITADPTNLSDNIFVNGTLRISSGSGGIIPVATFDAASTLLVEAQITSGLNQSFGNVQWNNNPPPFSSPTGDLQGNLIDIRGNLLVQDTGGDILYFDQAGTGTIEIGGNLSVESGSKLSLTETGNVTVNVGGNLVVEHNNLILNTGTGDATLNVDGTLQQNDATTLDLASASGGTGTLNLNGTGTVQNGTITASNGTGNLNFAASGTQTVDNTGDLVGSNLAITVDASSTLALNSNNSETLTLSSGSSLTVNGTLHTVAEGSSDGTIDGVDVPAGATFSLNSGATLNAGNTNGVSAAIVNSGGTTTFDPGANFILSTTNNTGHTGLSGAGISTLNALTVSSNSDDRYFLDTDITLNGALTLTNGTLDINGNTLTLNGTATRTGGELSADSTANLIIGGSAGTIDLSSAILTLGNFTVEAAGTATLGSPIGVFKYATIDGSLTTGGNLTLESDADNTGSLIQSGTLSGDVTIERFFDGAAANVSGHFFSSPVVSADLSTITVEGFNALSYDENGPALNSPATTDGLYKRVSGTMNVGQGYFTGNDNDQTIAFTGTPNNGAQTGKSFDGTAGLTLSSIVTDGIGDGWNLIGNPYPSAIDWSLVATTDLANGGAAYLWDEDAGNYVSGTGLIIPSSQGFFVQANADGATVSFANSNRVTTQGANDQFSVSRLMAGLPEQVLELKVQNLDSTNTTSDRTRIIFREQANPDYDESEDAKKFFGLDRAPSLYTRTPQRDVYTNVLPLPQVGEQVIVPLYLQPGKTSNFTLSVLNNMQHYGPSFRVYLEDQLTNQLIDLKQQPEYTFSSNTTDSSARFNIVFSTDAITSVDDIEQAADELQLFAAGRKVFLRSNRSLARAEITVLDLAGRVHLKRKYSGTGNTDIQLNNLQPGIYLVKVNSNRQLLSKKIFIE